MSADRGSKMSHSPTVDERVLKRIQHIWQLNRILLATGALVASILAIGVVRYRPILFNPTVKLFAHLSKQEVGPASILSGGLPELERVSFIAMQQELLFSYPLYRKVQEKLASRGLPKIEKPGVGKWQFLYGFLEPVIYGSEYLASRDRWQDAAFLSFRSNITYDQDPTLGTFTVGFKSLDPEYAFRMTSIVAQALIELNGEILNHKKVMLSKLLSEKLVEAEGEAQKAQEALRKFESLHNILESKDILADQMQPFLETAAELQKLEVQKEGEAAALEELKKIQADISAKISQDLTFGNRFQIESLLSKLQTEPHSTETPLLRRKLNQELQAPALPSALGTENFLQETKRLVLNHEHQLSSVQKQLSKLREIKKDQEQKLKKFPELATQLSQLLFKRNQRVRVLEALNEALLKLTLQGEGELAQIFTIEEPMITDLSVRSTKEKILFQLLAVSILALFSIFASYHLLRGTLFSKDDLRSWVSSNHLYLGAVPFYRDITSRNFLNRFSGDEELVKIARAFGSKETSKKTESGVNPHLILMGSAAPCAGKSISSAALAVGFNRLGNSVVIVDLDYRAKTSNLTEYLTYSHFNQRFSKNLNYFPKPGQVDQDFQNKICLIRPSKIEDFQDDQALLYFKNDLKADLELLRSQFDYIIVDGPPLYFSDAHLIAELCGSVVLCCPEGEATLPELQTISQQFEQGLSHPARLWVLITKARLSENLKTNLESYEYHYRNRKGRLAA